VSLVEVMFGLLGAVAVASALLVVTTKQLVHAALWLVVALGAVAGCYLLLSAEFVAWVQILIYVGAVVVLLLFGLMLTRAPIGVSVDLDAPPLQRAAAAVVSLGLACVVVVSAIDAFRGEHIRLDDDAGRGSSTSTGTALFRAWVLPFEVLSVLLLAALVGAIVLSRLDIGPDAEAEDAIGAHGRHARRRP
jgi:NADH-quinone oxidoreductase subunit J